MKQGSGMGIQRVGNRERGATMVEFALIAPLLLLLLLGMIEFGWKFGQYNDVRHAAREGARFAAVNAGSNDDIDTLVCQSFDGIDAGITEVRIQLDAGGGAAGDSGSIRVEASVDSLSGAPIISSFLPEELASDVEFRLEQAASSWTSDGSMETASC